MRQPHQCCHGKEATEQRGASFPDLVVRWARMASWRKHFLDRTKDWTGVSQGGDFKGEKCDEQRPRVEQEREKQVGRGPKHGILR